MKAGEKKLQPITLLKKSKDLQTLHNIPFNKQPHVDDLRPGGMDGKSEDQAAKLEKEKKQEAGGFTSVVTVQSVCESLLRDGFAQAFTDFFYITHERTPMIIRPSSKFMSDLKDNRIPLRRLKLDEEGLKSLKKRLIAIDELITDERWDKVIERYRDMADHFLVTCEEYHVATFYYEKCMNLAEKRKDNIAQAIAKKGFAKCNVFFDRADDAIVNLNEAIALAHDDEQTMKSVSKELIEIYKTMAQRCENDVINPDEQENALVYYEKCLEVCSQADDTESEGQIAYKIGQIYFKKGEYQKAIENQNIYLKIASNMKEMEAFAALAQCYMKLNDDDQAMNYLTQYQKLTQNEQSKSDTSMHGQKADAEKHMANLYWKKGDKVGALEFFNQFFDNAKADKQAKGRRVLDSARIAVGLAKGTTKMDQYIEMVTNSRENIYDLVAWKYQKDKK